MEHKPSALIAIEGLIGAGKSAVINSLSNITYKYPEPLHDKLNDFTFYDYHTNVFSELYREGFARQHNLKSVNLHSSVSIQALIIETFCDF